ncbi:MAG: hypothetical protein ACM3JG_14140 [Thiohalocapsa sp.]
MPFDGVGFASPKSLDQIDAVIERLGAPERWCKGALRSHDGRYCIRGAVRAVGGAEVLEPVILQAIAEVAGKRFGRIESFNDHPNTSHAQVVAVLSRARDNIVAGRLAAPHEVAAKEPKGLAALGAAVRRWFA